MRRLVSIVTVTAAIVLTAGCGTGGAARSQAGQDASPPAAGVTLTSATSPAPADAPAVPAVARPVLAEAEVPATFLAVRDGTRLVVADTATGKDQRVLFDLGPQEDDGDAPPQGIDGLALSSDGSTAYFSVGPEPAPSTLYRVALAGGPAERIGWGWRPRVSPDGRKLAYIALQTVVVQDLATGTARHLDVPEDDPSEPLELAWAPDSRHLVLQAQWAPSLRVLDTDTAANQADGPLLGSNPDGGEYWLTGVRATDGLIGALIALYPPESDAAEPARAFAVLDPATGAEQDRIDLPFAAVDSVYDASSRHQLFVAEDGSLHRRSGGGFTPIPGAGATLVAW